MRCPTCGQKIPDFAPACPRCGWDAVEYTLPSAPGEESGGAEPIVELPEPGYGVNSGTGPDYQHDPDWVPAPGGRGIPPDVATDLTASTTVAAPTPAPAPRKRRGLAVLVGFLALLLVGGGAALAGGYVPGWFGGKRPSDVRPASTVAYLQVDLNPTLDQKARAWDYLRDLPGMPEALGTGWPDPKRVLWEALNHAWGTQAGADFDKEVAPWLGDRLGFGVVPVGSDGTLVTAIQLTDEEKGAAKIREWIAASEQAYDVTVRDGFALITTRGDAEFVNGELSKGVLRGNPRFAADLGSVGDAGWVSGWCDFAKLATLTYGFESPLSDVQGRAVFALRFSPDTMELAGKVVGWNHPSVSGAGELGNLPVSTGIGISVSGGEEGLTLAWPWLVTVAKSWSQYRLDERDVAALLGRNISFSSPSGASETIGLRIVTDDATRADRALREVAPTLDLSTPVYTRVDDDVLIAATTSAYSDELSLASPPLSSLGVFTAVVPDHVAAASAFFVNLQPIWEEWPSDDGSPYESFLRSLQAIGGQYLDQGSGSGAWTVRLLRA